MTKKLHQLKGTIDYVWSGKTKSKHDFYALEITQIYLFTESKTTLYAFSDLVNKEVWNTLKQQTFQNQKYLFWCEKRTRGWRLKKWEQAN